MVQSKKIATRESLPSVASGMSYLGLLELCGKPMHLSKKKKKKRRIYLISSSSFFHAPSQICHKRYPKVVVSELPS